MSFFRTVKFLQEVQVVSDFTDVCFAAFTGSMSNGRHQTGYRAHPGRVPLKNLSVDMQKSLGIRSSILAWQQCSIHSVMLMISTTCTYGSMVSKLGVERAI
jgi:hypothetical protein